ncbi:hypothetical protein A3841_19360 [Pontibacter flavimaris]|uniref:Uncharacterized protein n=1 Tax=Pontibacter flavimaris TaxID=1797110 RepID=A0A1Q5PE89_9BACT|nr:hypothetical protein A3841_19360 [Pontibacter flavimaris]
MCAVGRRGSGDLYFVPCRHFAATLPMVSPKVALDKLKAESQVDSIFSIQLIEPGGKPVCQL